MKNGDHLNSLNILNIEILNITVIELSENLNEGVLVTPNVDHLVKLQKDREFYEIYRKADWIICDSKIVAGAFRFLNTPIKEVIPGSSFFSDFYNYHKDDTSIKIFLLGAAEGVAYKAMKKINKQVGRDIVVKSYSPSYGFERNESECLDIIDVVNKSKATVLVVGVGAPKQEKWIFKYKDKMPDVKIFMPLGATIDFEAGNLERAPRLLQKFGLEWLFRLLKEPKRLWKRYLIEDVSFLYYLIKQRLGLYKDPFDK